jgi:hypothetical protein
MQLDVRRFRLELWPFALTFLHAIFAKDALTGGDGWADCIRVERL